MKCLGSYRNALTPLLARLRALRKVQEAHGSLPSKLKIGHRGAAGSRPENTFSSFDYALQLGADFLEFDVQRTKDGELAVIHDPTVDRTTDGKGKVSALTWNELRSLDAGSWHSKEFAGEVIPSFTEMLDKYADKAGLLIELKKPALYPGIEEQIAEELKSRKLDKGPETRIIIQSFDRSSMEKIHSLLPSVPVGILLNYKTKRMTGRELEQIAKYASYLNPKHTIASRKLLDRIHQKGMKAIIWTIRTEKEAGKALRLPADGIVTDFIELLD
ncbi:glycerophosphodiester phosphodiesterase [Bacillus infantis]|uniref:glycerophosphodiester phosphodiesterase n=1 Tax=Bacillus infantis TaxID=324767 RepID=UPI00215523B6|nr:glycerophosphodiester phosphodiesterase family protein [Bacillus infantis]MCR6610160.1 glycerophosphodiester phosphodiesterase [Bacillus infantis]